MPSMRRVRDYAVLDRLGARSQSQVASRGSRRPQTDRGRAAMKRWLLKVRRPGGGASVIDQSDDKTEMDNGAVMRNHAYQTDSYYVEERR